MMLRFLAFLALFYSICSSQAVAALNGQQRVVHMDRSGKEWPGPGDTHVSYRGDGTGLPRVYKALTSCPDITSLDLKLTMTGCVVEGGPWRFQFREGDRFPALKELKLYEFDNTPDRSPSGFRREEMISTTKDLIREYTPIWASEKLLPYVESFEKVEDEPREDYVEQWRQAMDFSQLEELTLNQDDYFYSSMASYLPSLHTLEMEWPHDNTTISEPKLDFLRTVPPLKSLKIKIGAPYLYRKEFDLGSRTPFPLETILSTHGETLTSLELHQTESEEPNIRRPMLSPAQLQAIKTSCPNLTHLGLDIDRNGTFPYEFLDELMRIPSLTSASLGMEIGEDLHRYDFSSGRDHPATEPDPDGGPYREPRVSKQVAEELFAYLRKKKVGRKLDSAKFTVGDYSELHYMGPLRFEPWGEDEAKLYVCKARAVERKEVDKHEEVICRAFGRDDPRSRDNYEAAMEIF